MPIPFQPRGEAQLRCASPAPVDPSSLRRVLVLKPDRLVAELLAHVVATVTAAATSVATTIAAADLELASCPVDLLVTDVFASDGDVLDRIPHWFGRNPGVERVWIVTERKEPLVFDLLTRLPLAGVFDQSSGSMQSFGDALRTVARGETSWSPEILSRIASNKRSLMAIIESLSSTERLVLAIIGDGCDDALAAESVGMAESSVNTIRRELHRALRVQHKGELVKCARELGFVVNTPHGVVRPGFGALMGARRSRLARRLGRLQVLSS